MLTAAGLALAIGQQALAQETGAAASVETGVESGEIVVTAQKRAQNLRDVGVSISALTADGLRARGVNSTQDLSRTIVGVTMDSISSGGYGATLVVRGVSQSDFAMYQESPNSVYVDEIYLSSSASAAFPLYDLDRIEVLRGPQGTLFGRASSGGLASFFTKRPGKTASGYAQLDYGSFNEVRGEAAFGGPISDHVRFRLAGRAERADGWWKNNAPGGKNAIESRFYGIRGQIEADLSSNLTALLIASYDKNPRALDGAYHSVPFYVTGGTPQPLPDDVDAYGKGPGKDLNGYREASPKGPSGSFNNVGYVSNYRFSPTLNLTLKLPNATVTSITNYTKFHKSYNEDCDGGPVDACQTPIDFRIAQFSQELRVNGEIGPLTYTAGGYYLNTRQRLVADFITPALSGTPSAFFASNPIHQKLDSSSVFGQLEYKVSPAVKLTVGGRYSHDVKSFTSQVLLAQSGTTINNPPQVIYDFSAATAGRLASRKDDMWSGKVQVDYKPSRDVLLYVGISRGAKGGGFNANLGGGLSFADTPFKAESMIDYEAGAKLRLLDGKANLNLGVFNYDYTNFQGYSFVNLQGVVGNYNGYFRGGEAELELNPGGGFHVQVGGSLSRYAAAQCAQRLWRGEGHARRERARMDGEGQYRQDVRVRGGCAHPAMVGRLSGQPLRLGRQHRRHGHRRIIRPRCPRHLQAGRAEDRYCRLCRQHQQRLAAGLRVRSDFHQRQCHPQLCQAALVRRFGAKVVLTLQSVNASMRAAEPMQPLSWAAITPIRMGRKVLQGPVPI